MAHEDAWAAGVDGLKPGTSVKGHVPADVVGDLTSTLFRQILGRIERLAWYQT